VSTLNPAQTIIVPPADIPWKVPDVAPPNTVAEAILEAVRTRTARTWCS
jgi:hypothetical protein